MIMKTTKEIMEHYHNYCLLGTTPLKELDEYVDKRWVAVDDLLIEMQSIIDGEMKRCDSANAVTCWHIFKGILTKEIKKPQEDEG